MSRCSATGFMTSSTEAGICEVFERNAAQGTGGIWPAGRRLDQRGPPQPRPPLLSFQLWQGLTLPERFHGVFSPSSCGLLPPLASHARLSPQQSVSELVQGWAAEFKTWFYAQHAVPAALRSSTARSSCDRR
jgi:hypothetical protein